MRCAVLCCAVLRPAGGWSTAQCSLCLRHAVLCYTLLCCACLQNCSTETDCFVLLQVVTFTADLGQGEELEPARKKVGPGGTFRLEH